MYKEELIAYYDSKLDEVRANYYFAAKRNDPDGVHDLRVELKRLKAFFNLIESVNPSFNSDERFVDFKLIAKKIAALRDSQVQIELLGELKPRTVKDPFPGKNFPVFLKRKENEAVASFAEYTKTFPLEKLNDTREIIEKTLSKISPEDMLARAIKRFFFLKSEFTSTVKAPVVKEETLHKVRILTKETHYTLEILQKCFHTFENAKVFIDEVKKAHQAIGKWHDFEVGILYISRYLVEEENSFEECAMLARRYRSEKRAQVMKAKTAFINYQDHPEIFGQDEVITQTPAVIQSEKQ